MFSLFSKKEDTKFSLIFDVQSTLVRASLVMYKKNHKPTHLWSAKIEIPKKAHTGPEYLVKMITKSIDEICEGAIHQNQNIKINTVEMVLSSPWVLSYSKIYRTDFEKETRIGIKNIEDSVKKAEEKVTELTRDYDVEIVERKIYDVKINGYSTDNFENRLANSLDVSVALTVGSKNVFKKMYDHVLKNIHTKSVGFHSALLLHYSSLSSLLLEKSDFVSIHVHGELTDIVVVKKGMCSFVGSFPFGVSTLLRKIAKDTHQSEDIVDSSLSLFSGEKLVNAEMDRVKKYLEEPLKGWGHDLQKILRSFGDDATIPSTFILSTHSHYNIFEKSIRDTIHDPRIQKFNESIVEKMVIYDKRSEKSPLLGMYSLAISHLDNFKL